MAKLVTTYECDSEETLNQLLGVFCVATGYQPVILNEEGNLKENPVTVYEHVNSQMASYFKSVVVGYSASMAASQAGSAAQKQAEDSTALVTMMTAKEAGIVKEINPMIEEVVKEG